MQILSCEICGSSYNLSFAHRVKRRKITTQEELEYCALLCAVHHDQIEFSGHAVMYERITEIIEKRKSYVDQY